MGPGNESEKMYMNLYDMNFPCNLSKHLLVMFTLQVNYLSSSYGLFNGSVSNTTCSPWTLRPQEKFRGKGQY